MEPTLLSLLASIDMWQVLAIAAKFMLYNTCFVASGGMFFLVLFNSFITKQERDQISRVIYWSCWAGIIFSLLRIVIMDDMLSGEWLGITNWNMTWTILTSREGLSLAIRLSGLCIVLLLCQRKTLGWLLIPLLAGAFALPVSLGVVGHASELALQTGWIPQAMIYLHLFAVTFWLGALWPLYRITLGSDTDKVGLVMDKFGKLAVFVVAILAGVGFSLLAQLLGSLNLLWESSYGKFILWKLLGVSCLLIFAAVNKLRLTPALLIGDASVIRRLRKSILTEILIAGFILLVTASMTVLTGAPALN